MINCMAEQFSQVQEFLHIVVPEAQRYGLFGREALQAACDAEAVFSAPTTVPLPELRELFTHHERLCWSDAQFMQACMLVGYYRNFMAELANSDSGTEVDVVPVVVSDEPPDTEKYQLSLATVHSVGSENNTIVEESVKGERLPKSWLESVTKEELDAVEDINHALCHVREGLHEFMKSGVPVNLDLSRQQRLIEKLGLSNTDVRTISDAKIEELIAMYMEQTPKAHMSSRIVNGICFWALLRGVDPGSLLSVRAITKPLVTVADVYNSRTLIVKSIEQGIRNPRPTAGDVAEQQLVAMIEKYGWDGSKKEAVASPIEVQPATGGTDISEELRSSNSKPEVLVPNTEEASVPQEKKSSPNLAIKGHIDKAQVDVTAEKFGLQERSFQELQLDQQRAVINARINMLLALEGSAILISPNVRSFTPDNLQQLSSLRQRLGIKLYERGGDEPLRLLAQQYGVKGRMMHRLSLFLGIEIRVVRPLGKEPYRLLAATVPVNVKKQRDAELENANLAERELLNGLYRMVLFLEQ